MKSDKEKEEGGGSTVGWLAKTGEHTLLPCRSESDRMPGRSLAAAEEVVLGNSK